MITAPPPPRDVYDALADLLIDLVEAEKQVASAPEK